MSVTIRNAYQLFKAGHDTLDIAKMTGRPEHEIHQEINMCRSAVLHKPYPYRPYLTPTILHIPAPMRRQGFCKARYRRPPQNAERNRQILEELASGKTLEAVGERFGLSKQRIWQIFSQQRAA